MREDTHALWLVSRRIIFCWQRSLQCTKEEKHTQLSLPPPVHALEFPNLSLGYNVHGYVGECVDDWEANVDCLNADAPATHKRIPRCFQGVADEGENQSYGEIV
jgi:hypothetical protein